MKSQNWYLEFVNRAGETETREVPETVGGQFPAAVAMASGIAMTHAAKGDIYLYIDTIKPYDKAFSLRMDPQGNLISADE